MLGRICGNFADFSIISGGISSEKLHFSIIGIPADIVCIGHPVTPLRAATRVFFPICYPVDYY